MTEIKCNYDELVDPKTLEKNPMNPNKHTSEQLTEFAAILHYQGIRKPIVVSNLSGYIIKGHGLLEACLINQCKEVPVEYQDYQNHEQEYSDMVADNELNRRSKTDFAMINEDIAELGPEIDLRMMAIPDFEIEPMDKYEDESWKDESKPNKVDSESEKAGSEKQYKIMVMFPNEEEMMDGHDHFLNQGYLVKIL